MDTQSQRSIKNIDHKGGATMSHSNRCTGSVFDCQKCMQIEIEKETYAALKKSNAELLKACKASQIFLLDDDLYAQTATLRKTLSDAIKSAESLEVKP